MNHLVRAGLLLGAVLVTFGVMRTLLVQGTVTLSEFALKPVARQENAQEWASLNPRYSDAWRCDGVICHGDIYDAWVGSAHGGVNCETCHGPALAHVRDVSVPVGTVPSEQLCVLCHDQVVGRPDNFPQIDPGGHYPESNCVSCHSEHRPGPPAFIPHGTEVGSDCLSCHQAGGVRSPAPPGDHAARSNDECLNCHETAENEVQGSERGSIP